MLHTPPIAKITASASPAAGDWLCNVPGVPLAIDAGIKWGTAEVPTAPAKGKRPGARGKGIQTRPLSIDG